VADFRTLEAIMRTCICLVSVLVLTSLFSPAGAVDEKYWIDCNNEQSPDSVITACAKVIDDKDASDADRSRAYNQRAIAYQRRANSEEGDLIKQGEDRQQAIDDKKRSLALRPRPADIQNLVASPDAEKGVTKEGVR
jgi:hypothetical protein